MLAILLFHSQLISSSSVSLEEKARCLNDLIDFLSIVRADNSGPYIEKSLIGAKIGTRLFKNRYQIGILIRRAGKIYLGHY